MYHPWRAFRALAHYTLDIAWLPDGVLAVTDFEAHTVTMAKGLLQAERRSTIAHELEHISRGWAPCQGVGAGREECVVDQAASRRLIQIRDLGEALAWAHDLDEAAEELWVDRAMLEVRLAHLHPAERAYLRRRLENAPAG
ncbi:MAG: hypothetical protein QM638_01040 [Nocardioides sp.]|uniref:hypothetical protein n=1 Tax=Nocardioides sp. TaxID=35761 RepID=UPI0039E69A51